MPKVIIYADEQEQQEIVVQSDGGDELFSASQNHDSHGWEGMETARDIAEGIAEALGVSCTTEYKEFG